MNSVKEKLVELIGKARKEAAKKCRSFFSCKDCPNQDDNNPMCRNTYIAESLIANGVTVQRWIPVTERLPDNDYGKHWKERKYYLVRLAPSGLMCVAHYGYKEYGWWIEKNIRRIAVKCFVLTWINLYKIHMKWEIA